MSDKVWIKHVEDRILVTSQDNDNQVRDLFLMALHELEVKDVDWGTLTVETERYPGGGQMIHFSAYAIKPR